MPNWRKRTVVGLVVCLLHLSLADWEAVMKRGIKTLLILPLVPGFGFGQSAQNNWDNLKELASGQQVRIVLNDAKSYQGKLQSLTDDVIVVRLKTGDQTFERQSVLRVSRKRRPHRGRNALIGVGAGVLTLIAYDATGCQDCDQSTKIGDAAAGALLGAAVGALVPTGVGWHDLYRAR